MTPNDAFKNLRSTFDLNDEKVIAIFSLAELKVDARLINLWLKEKNDPDYKVCKDVELACFLNGLIVDKRGSSDGPQPVPEDKITNNMILRKLKIALDLKNEDLVNILKLAKFNISNHELTGFFRRPEHKNFRRCKDQVLLTFLKGLQLKFRPSV